MDKALGKVRDTILRLLLGESSKPPCDDDVYGDDVQHMTGGRLIARFLSRYSWYHPRNKHNTNANLDQAWAYYEHYTLARIFTTDETGTKNIERDFVRAPAGEADRRTVLYPLFATPLKELGDWGFSVRIYFSTLRILASALFVSGLLNIPLSIYFWSSSYSSNPEERENSVPWLVQTSALCTDHQEVEALGLVRNVCNFEDWFFPGILSYGASILILLQLAFCFYVWQRKAEIVFDEEIQTASDYSIKVTNVPPQALDPLEWKEYFDQFAEDPRKDGVTFISIAIDNAKLLHKIVERRKLLRRIQRKFPNVDHQDATAVEQARTIEHQERPWWSKGCCGGGLMLDQLAKLNHTIRGLLEEKYSAVAVFVIFESERSQRNALHCLSTGRLQLWSNHADMERFRRGKLCVHEKAKKEQMWNTFGIRTDGEKEIEMHSINLLKKDLTCEVGTTRTRLERILRFKGRVLKVKEASEPNDVRWTDLQVPAKARTLQYIASTVAMIGFVAWSGFFIHWLEDKKPGLLYTPLFITATNIVVPSICEVINAIESHSTEASRQASLYSKVALFRWFNSAIALTLVFGFTKTINIDGSYGQSLGEAAYNLICAEMFSNAVIKMCDFGGLYRKHFLAPRAYDQEEMNACFVGTRCDLAERYTDATKVLCVALFFSPILPATLFLGAAAMAVHFALAKFALLRMGSTTTDVGTRLSRLSRNVFFSSSLVLHFVMCGYWWSGYPYDNVCESSNDGNALQRCNQDFLRQSIFPPFPSYQTEGLEWMSSSQETIVSLYAWTTAIVVVLSAIILLKMILLPFFQKFFESQYAPVGKDQQIPFSKVKSRQEVEGYLPNMKEMGFSYPLLAFAATQDIDADLYDWKGHEEHPETSVTADISEVLNGAEPKSIVLSPVRYWSYNVKSPSLER